MKSIVKKVVNKYAFEYLNKTKMKLKKMKKLNYHSLKMKPYLLSSKINNRKKKLAFKIRCRMANVKNNFGSKVICQICKKADSKDDQVHAILQCDKLIHLIPDSVEVSYEDIFSENCDKIEIFLKIADSMLRARQKLLKNK